jgi:hypothetical protein
MCECETIGHSHFIFDQSTLSLRVSFPNNLDSPQLRRKTSIGIIYYYKKHQLKILFFF